MAIDTPPALLSGSGINNVYSPDGRPCLEINGETISDTPVVASEHTEQETNNSLLAMKRHRLSALFAQHDLAGQEFQQLVDSITREGVIQPITTLAGEILTGWNVYLGSIAAGVEPVFVELGEGHDPWEYVKASNLCRRHQTPNERLAMLMALQLDRERFGPGSECSKLNTPSVREIAKGLDVSIGTAQKAATILRDGDPEVIQAVADGTISLEAAASVAKLPVADRPAALITLKDPELVKAACPKKKHSVAAGNGPTVTQSPKMKAPGVHASADASEAEIQRLKVTIKEHEEEICELTEALERELETTRSLKIKCAELEMKIAKLESKAHLPCRETASLDPNGSLLDLGEASTVVSGVEHQVVETTERCRVIDFVSAISQEVSCE